MERGRVVTARAEAGKALERVGALRTDRDNTGLYLSVNAPLDAVIDVVWPIAQAAALREAARRIDGFGDANWYADEPHGRLRLNQAAMLRDQADQIEQSES